MSNADSDRTTLPSCYACLGKERGVRLSGTRGIFKLIECTGCGLRFWYPLAQAPKEYFEVNYISHSDPSQLPSLELRHKLFLKNLPTRSGSTLDIGCGDKPLVHELYKLGFDAWGIDFNRGAIEKSKKIYGLKNFYPLSVYEFLKLSNLPKFEIISFFEVLEHIEAPEQFIKSVRNLLSDDGYIVLSIPDSSMFGPWEYAHNAPPYHTAYWNRRALEEFLKNHGFKIILERRIGMIEDVVASLNILMKLGLFRAGSSLTENTDGKRSTNNAPRLVRRMAKIVLLIVGYPVGLALWAANKRPVIFVIAKKQNSTQCAHEDLIPN